MLGANVWRRVVGVDRATVIEEIDFDEESDTVLVLPNLRQPVARVRSFSHTAAWVAGWRRWVDPVRLGVGGGHLACHARRSGHHRVRGDGCLADGTTPPLAPRRSNAAARRAGTSPGA